MKTFKLTDPGEGLTEAEIISWRVKEGDQVKVNDIVVEVETSKSLVELPIPWAGTVTKILVPEGETVDVGTPLIEIDDGSGPEPATAGPADSAAASSEKDSAASSDEDKPAQRTPNLVGYGAVEGSKRRRPRKAPVDPSAAQVRAQVSDAMGTNAPVARRADDRAPLETGPTQPNSTAPLPSPGHPARIHDQKPGSRPLTKPSVRRVARDLGLDLTQIAGSGEGGIITHDDVVAKYAETQQPTEASGSAAGERPAAGGERRVPIKGVRKVTAEAMVRSAFTAPHVTEWVTVDVTASIELLQQLQNRREFQDVKLSPLLLVAKACCIAMRRNPELNSSWDEAAQEIIYRDQVNLGIAAATPRGLLVPNIKDAGSLSLKELAQAMKELVTTAKEGRTQPADTSHGSFTISNVGIFGVDAGTPILNPGEAGILAMGAIERRPWVTGANPPGDFSVNADERIEARWVTTLALSFDHRLVDGEQGSKFLADVAAILHDPLNGLLF